MNVLLHALTGGAIAHASFRIGGVAAAKSNGVTLVGVALAAIASHGLLDWLRHDYPFPARLDVVFALAVSGVWLCLVQPRLRFFFATALAASFLPDVVDHLPRLLHIGSPLPTPVFPWHSPTWSGSLYPAVEIRTGSNLVALEAGHNRLVSALNHFLVGLISLVSIFLGRSAFAIAGR
jgi:hypothetical protein